MDSYADQQMRGERLSRSFIRTPSAPDSLSLSKQHLRNDKRLKIPLSRGLILEAAVGQRSVGLLEEFKDGNDYLHSRILGRGSRPANPLVSLLAVGSRCRGSQPTTFYPQTVSFLDGFNVRGSADVR